MIMSSIYPYKSRSDLSLKKIFYNLTIVYFPIPYTTIFIIFRVGPHYLYFAVKKKTCDFVWPENFPGTFGDPGSTPVLG